jgi:ubiquinone/menaquinone biosynthesis C-methylase UbiE
MNGYDPAGAPGLHDPEVPPWAQLALPDGWPDRLRLTRPRDLWRFLRKLFLRQVGKVELPAGLPLAVPLPKYLLLEFHNLPNGNYSKKVTRGYSTGFDIVMLGTMARARRALARALLGAASILDAGCGAGNSTQALGETGADDIWGLDASPYLLQHAARQYPERRFVQGLAERTGFGDARFDAVSACFVFHELPPRYAGEALDEFHRVLKPGGRIALLEPASTQFFDSPWSLLRRYGWRGLYFRVLARFVNEPFVRAWHQVRVGEWLASHGFELEQDLDLFPSRLIVARRIARA